jgi:hypothetical protein
MSFTDPPPKFINKAAGIKESLQETRLEDGVGESLQKTTKERTGTKVGHGLESCTHQIQIIRCFDAQQNRRIVFVDTPGFDDTNISDLDILRMVADWLKLT